MVVSENGTCTTYSFTASARHKGYKFQCGVKNAVGSVEPSVVTLTVK